MQYDLAMHRRRDKGCVPIASRVDDHDLADALAVTGGEAWRALLAAVVGVGEVDGGVHESDDRDQRQKNDNRHDAAEDVCVRELQRVGERRGRTCFSSKVHAHTPCHGLVNAACGDAQGKEGAHAVPNWGVRRVSCGKQRFVRV